MLGLILHCIFEEREQKKERRGILEIIANIQKKH